MRLAVVIAALAAAALAGACTGQDFAPDRISLGDRCADIVKRAMPFADIDIGDVTAKNAGTRTIIAQVNGTRTEMAANSQLQRDLVAECTFVDNVLTAFRWTKGGPPSPP
jgi:hypothetical protein